MKKIFILLIVMSLLLIGTGYLSELNNKLMGKTIVIDVGHGGVDSGTVYDNVSEKDINLDIAIKLKKLLIKNGVNVLMIREGDYDISLPNVNRRKKSDFDNRIKYINDSNADLYLSIHINYLGDERYYGSQVFYTKGNENIAGAIQQSLKDKLGTPMNEKLLDDSIYMYKKINIPGVLIECGFLSNAKERKLLQDDKYQDRLVSAIVGGLLEYY